MDSTSMQQSSSIACYALHRRATVALQESLPAVQLSANPNTLCLLLVFAEYTPILLPILQRKHILSICQEQSSAPWLRWCLHALLFRSPCIFTLYLYDHPVFYQSPCSFSYRKNQSQSGFERALYLFRKVACGGVIHISSLNFDKF